MKRIIWQSKAMKQVLKIKDTAARMAIVADVKKLADWPDVSKARKLVNIPGYRLAVGPFRVFFAVSGDTVYITEVKKRNERTY